jgi:hypothetical protein
MPAAWKKFAALVVLAALGPAPTPAADPPPVALPLTQFEVLGLVQQGLGDEAVIARLRETGSTFRLSPNDAQMLKALGVSDRVMAAMTADAPGRLEAKAVAGGRPVGKWVRESGPVRVALHFTEDRLTVTATLPNPDDKAVTPTLTVTADADYSVNRDGLLYGVITSFDCDHPEAAVYQCLAEHTFSARCRVDGSVLAVRDVKFLGSGVLFQGKDGGAVSMIVLGVAGRYEKDDGSKPAAQKPAKSRPNPVGARRAVPPVAVRQAVGVAPDGQPIERVGIDNPPLPAPPVIYPATALPPPLLAPAVNMTGPALPAAPAPVPPSPPALPPATGMIPPPLPPSPPTGSKLAGTWVREFDGMQVVLKFTDKRVFATLNVAYVVDGTKDEARMTFRSDADYSVGPDGTVYGVVTGTDFTPPKGDAGALAAWPKELVKLNGMPFCFRHRIDEGMLSVRDLRTDVPGGEASSTVVLGRYTRVEKEPAPPKPGRMPVAYSTDPNIRMEQLLNSSFGSGPIGETAPAPRTVPLERLHGGIIK